MVMKEHVYLIIKNKSWKLFMVYFFAISVEKIDFFVKIRYTNHSFKKGEMKNER